MMKNPVNSITTLHEVFDTKAVLTCLHIKACECKYSRTSPSRNREQQESIQKGSWTTRKRSTRQTFFIHVWTNKCTISYTRPLLPKSTYFCHFYNHLQGVQYIRSTIVVLCDEILQDLVHCKNSTKFLKSSSNRDKIWIKMWLYF